MVKKCLMRLQNSPVGNRVGTSTQGAFSTRHYDAKGNRVGTTQPSAFGRSTTRLDKKK